MNNQSSRELTNSPKSRYMKKLQPFHHLNKSKIVSTKNKRMVMMFSIKLLKKNQLLVSMKLSHLLAINFNKKNN